MRDELVNVALQKYTMAALGLHAFLASTNFPPHCILYMRLMSKKHNNPICVQKNNASLSERADQQRIPNQQT